MRFFDIGANRGDACLAAINLGYDEIIALEPAPRIYRTLVSNFIYSKVIPLKLAVSSSCDHTVEFFEAEEDGLSTLNAEWLTGEEMPYNGKPFRSVKATTITLDRLTEIYGEPDLMKIDVEGAEWEVFRGMTKHHGKLAFEWTDVTLDEHEEQLWYLHGLGYTEVAPQFITHHLEEPTEWVPLLDENGFFSLRDWVWNHAEEWKETGWKVAGLRPTADVGMCWVR
jgi:FkbM family methyltransferase